MKSDVMSKMFSRRSKRAENTGSTFDEVRTISSIRPLVRADVPNTRPKTLCTSGDRLYPGDQVMRHLDSGYDGTVEVQEVVAAVRRIRKDEGIIRAAQRNAGPHWHPERHVSGNGNGGARGWGDNCEAGEYHKGLAPFRATNRHTASHGVS